MFGSVWEMLLRFCWTQTVAVVVVRMTLAHRGSIPKSSWVRVMGRIWILGEWTLGCVFGEVVRARRARSRLLGDLIVPCWRGYLGTAIVLVVCSVKALRKRRLAW